MLTGSFRKSCDRFLRKCCPFVDSLESERERQEPEGILKKLMNFNNAKEFDEQFPLELYRKMW